jgi:hypothetical protein
LIREEKFIKEQIEDAGIQQEHYLLDIDWAIEYTAYLKQSLNSVREMSPVNNKPLIDHVLGTVKKGLKESNEYVFVNEKTWLFLMNLYGGGPEISRSFYLEELSLNSIQSRTSSLFSDYHQRTLETQKSDQLSTVESAMSNSIAGYNRGQSITGVSSLDQNGFVAALQSPPLEPGNAVTLKRINSVERHQKKYSLVRVPFNNYGLQNTSNYCFLNACLQCLLCFEELNEYFENEKYKLIKYKTSKDLRFSTAYSDLLRSLRKTSSKTNYTNAAAFKKHIRKVFDPYEQHDIQEFLRFVLSEIQDELNPSNSKKKITSTVQNDPEQAWILYQKLHLSIIDKLFSGQLLNQVTCKKCNNVSRTVDPFLDLSIPINGKSLYESLSSFFAEENLPDLYKCENCKKKASAKKNMIISKTPKILVIHLKRFKTYPTKRKILDFVDFPIERLDIKKFFQFFFSFLFLFTTYL